MKILIIQNCAGEDLGLINRLLAEESIPSDTVHPYRGDQFPEISVYSAVIIGGTPDAVYKKDELEYLEREFGYVSGIVSRDIPVLGICGGAQLLSMVLGGEVKPNKVREIGTYDVSLTGAGKKSPLFAGFPERFPVVQWHGDTFSIPDGAKHLASSPDCTNQAFSFNRISGIQFHIETGRKELASWARLYRHELPAMSKTESGIVGEFLPHEAMITTLGKQLLRNFLNS